eukprot:s2981_g5.t1
MHIRRSPSIPTQIIQKWCHAKEIRIDAARTSGAGEEQRQTVRFQVQPDFENSPERGFRGVKTSFETTFW